MTSCIASGRLLALGALVLTSLSACQRQEAKTPSDFEALAEDPGVLLERIAWLRQLPQLRPTHLVFHDPEEFQRVVDTQVRTGGVAPTSADHPAFQHAFGFADAQGHLSESLASVQRDEIVAFFDESTFTVHVRADADRDADTSIDPTWVVAHEVGHSLQHQHFPIPDIARYDNEDQRLAALAMLEGDAMLVMLAYAAYEQHAPLTRVIARVERAVAADEAEPYRSVSHSSAALDHSPASVRERLVFPYLSGVGLMGSLFRAGGYGLVNRVYSSPPQTTEQVLHPEKYVAGEVATPVAVPSLLVGFQHVASGQMGELQTKTLLRACNRPQVAAEAAAGWGGDAFVIGRRGQSGLLLWATTWDTVGDAEQFEQALRATAFCWQRDLGPAAGATRVLRVGQNVAVTRGLAPAQSEPVLVELARRTHPVPPRAPPLGPVVLRPPPAAPLKVPPRLVGSTLVAPYLALTLPVPAGFVAKPEADVFLTSTRSSGTFLVFVSDWVVSTETNERLFADFLDTFLQAFEVKRDRVVVTSNGSLSTPLGPAYQRTWNVVDTSFYARVALVPACQGTGALVIANTWSDTATLGQIDWIISGIRQFGAGSPPLCADLNP